MRAADAVCSGRELLEEANHFNDAAISLRNVAKRFHRNGVAVGCFVAFESFIGERTSEIARALTAAALPKGMYPDSLVRESKAFSPLLLADMLGKPHLASQIDETIEELAAAWSSAPQAWTVPRSVMKWRGSNISADHLTRVPSLFGVPRDWSDLTGIVTALGIAQPLPTEQVFKSIANVRHLSAHDSSYSAEIMELRGAPRLLTSLGFAFDALVSASASCIAKSQRIPKGSGRGAIDLTRLVWRRGRGGTDQWGEYRGAHDPRAAPKKAVKIWDGDCLAQVAASRTGARDVVVAIRPASDGAMTLDDWRMPI